MSRAYDRRMLLTLLFSATFIHATEAIELNQPMDGCSSHLELGQPVVGRWLLKDSRIAPLRLQEALLRLPETEIFELLVVNRSVNASDRMHKVLEKTKSVEFLYWRSDFAYHDWNYGAPEDPVELFGVQAKPEELLKLLASIPQPYEALIIDPRAESQVSIEELNEFTRDHGYRKIPRVLLGTPHAHLLGRLRHEMSHMNFDDLLSVQFSALAVSVDEFYEVLKEVDSLQMKLGTQAFLRGLHGPVREIVGPALIEVKKPAHSQVLRLLARFPKLQVSAIKVPISNAFEGEDDTVAD